MEDGHLEGEESPMDISHPGDDEDEGDHFGVEEPDFFELGKNTSGELLIDALDKIRHFPQPDTVSSMIPVWLYVPQRPEVLQQLVQLNHEEHAFVMLTKGSYDLIGYLADHYQISPIYCDTALKQGQPWLHQLYQIGWLILEEADTTQLVLHALFHMTPAGGAYISAISSSYCRPNSQGVPLPTWSLENLRARSVQFHPAPFPYGYPPPTYPTVTPTAQSTYEAQASSSNIVEAYPLDTPLSSDALSTIDLQSMSNADLDFGYQHWGLSTTTSISSISESTWPVSNELIEASYEQPVPNDFHPDLQWRDKNASEWTTLTQSQRTTLNREMKQSLWPRIVLLTRWLFMGALWIGQDRDSLSVSPPDVRCLITNSFLIALDMVNTSYEEMLAQQVIIIEDGQTVSVGWKAFRVNLAKTLDNVKADLRKVIKGAMSTYTNFCQVHNMEERINYFVSLLNSDTRYQVQRAISELIVEQLFRELLWASLLRPISGLGDEGRNGRVADLFPEEILSKFKCLAQQPAALIIQIYSTMIMVLKEINPSNIDYHTSDTMHVIIMSALDEMYAQPHLYPNFRGAVMALPFLTECNVLPIEPKSQRPGFVSNRSRRRRMLDVVDIDTQSNTNDASMNVFGKVPNNGGFTYEKSLRSVWDVPESYFTSA
ncbi:uncharacterized protein F5147DRAFT_776213 [Suillus discolor]|uniref:Uncharacterized protein n=1 Tax=Suillus discolor TaxID=1912936 RepID=A0A9P7F1B3_9AGAM|nr:uncharacterized protein F5147DRAFT_776213 [Suillus discolor]KAG2102864.1 hypothetical protein F5147DRAFT_776213 [Suillus discolor]